MLGARHLGAMQALDFLTALAELLNHLVEVAAKIADFVVAMRETDRNTQIASTQLSNLLLQFDHRALHGVGENDEQGAADGDCARSGNEKHKMAVGIAPGKCGEQEEQHSAQQDAGDRYQRFDFPVDAQPR